LLVLCILLIPSCYNPERDLIQDPFNTPLIHILDSEYEPATGAVLIQWEYLGGEPLLRVILQRRNDSGFDSIGVGSVSTPVSPDRFIDTFFDPSPFSGELLEYAVTARTGRGAVHGRAVQVQVPGARLLRLRRNPFSGRIQVDWQSIGDNIASFEVVRSSAGGQTSLWVGGPGEDSFTDTDVLGDTPYTYRINTAVSGGAQLQSKTLKSQVYSLERSEQVGTGGRRAVVSSGSTVSSATLLVLTEDSGDVDISKYRYFFGASFDGSQSIGAIREETVASGLSGISIASIDVAGPSSFLPPAPNERLFVAARSGNGSAPVIRAFSLPHLNSVWEGPQDWLLSDPETPVLVAQTSDGLIYFSADRKIRVYTEDLSQLATYDLPFAQPGDMAGDENYLWAAVTSENRIVRTDIGSGLGPVLNWEDVDLEVGAGFSPTGLTFNRFGQLFVLDANARRVYAYDIGLSLLLSWSLPNEDFSAGGIALDGGSGNLIHVSSSSGSVFTYLP
jgi:hypothetical protein